MELTNKYKYIANIKNAKVEFLQLYLTHDAYFIVFIQENVKAYFLYLGRILQVNF